MPEMSAVSTPVTPPPPQENPIDAFRKYYESEHAKLLNTISIGKAFVARRQEVALLSTLQRWSQLSSDASTSTNDVKDNTESKSKEIAESPSTDGLDNSAKVTLAKLAAGWIADWKASTPARTLNRELLVSIVLLRELVSPEEAAIAEKAARLDDILGKASTTNDDASSSSTSSSSTSSDTKTEASTPVSTNNQSSPTTPPPSTSETDPANPSQPTEQSFEDEEAAVILAKEARYATLPNRGWEPVTSRTAYRQEEGKLIYSFKVSGVANCSIHDIFPIIYEAAHYKQWFPFMSDSSEIANVSRFHKVVSAVVKCPWPLSNRAFLLGM